MTGRRVFWVIGGVAAVLAAAVAALWTPDLDRRTLQRDYGGPPSRYAEVAPGLTVHYRDQGPKSGRTVVLLHGAYSSLHAWDGWLPHLTTDDRVVTIDLPGHGLTGPHPDDDYAIDTMVHTVDRLLAGLGIERVVIGGNSMGGWVAWRYAAAHPDKVDGLILVCAAGIPRADAAPGREPLGFRIAATPGLSWVARRLTPRWLAGESLRSVVGTPAAVDEAMVDRHWRLLRHPGNRQAALKRTALLRNPPPADALDRIATPTLILWGAEDPLLPAANAEVFHRRIAGSRLVVLDGLGHLPMEEAPDRTAAVVGAFLKGLPGPHRSSASEATPKPL